MKNIPHTIPVACETNPDQTARDNPAPGSGAETPPPDLLRSFVYREPTGSASDDGDSHPHRRRTDKIPQK